MLVRVAGIQMACDEIKEKNIERAVRLIALAAERGAQIICLQELFHTHWFPKEIDEKNFELAESMGGPTLHVMQPLARERQVVLVLPIFEKDGGDTYYNAAVVIDSGGEILGVYRKVHIPQIPLWEEKSYFSPGNTGFPVFQTSSGRIGVQICWDNFFPEGTRCLTLNGAEIIFAPTAAAFASQHRWQTMISANAMANGVFIMRVNRVGSEQKQDFYGRSFCVGPEGELRGSPTGMKEGILFADIDLREIPRYRNEYPLLSDRRPPVYADISDSAVTGLENETTRIDHEGEDQNDSGHSS
jgi:N-carbamoylputrescine amidase